MRMRRWSQSHTIAWLVLSRSAIGVLTLLVVSILVFAATQVLPGNAALAVLGHSVTPARVHQLEVQMHLNRPVLAQYGSWIGGLLVGHLGTSFANGQSVWHLVAPRLLNSVVLVAISGILGSTIGMALGAFSAVKRNSVADDSLSVTALAITALPEFVVAVVLVILLSTVVFHLLPGVSMVSPGVYPWNVPSLLVLPVATLVIVTVPYVFRMTRAATIEALESDYVEMARLKGAPTWRLLFVHALPNALAPIIQVIGLTFLYLAGGIVVVEFVFAFPGIGQGLVNAVSDRDIPVIQFIVIVLAAFYVAMNIATDVVALLVSPRRRIPR